MASRQLSNSNPINFDTPANTDPEYISWWTNAQASVYLGKAEADTTPDSTTGAAFRIPAGAWKVKLDDANQTDDALDRQLNGLKDGGLRFALHTGDPGAAGTANEVPDSGGYSRVTVSAGDLTVGAAS